MISLDGTQRALTDPSRSTHRPVTAHTQTRHRAFTDYSQSTHRALADPFHEHSKSIHKSFTEHSQTLHGALTEYSQGTLRTRIEAFGRAKNTPPIIQKDTWAKVPDLVLLGARFGHGATDSDLGRFPVTAGWLAGRPAGWLATLSNIRIATRVREQSRFFKLNEL